MQPVTRGCTIVSKQVSWMASALRMAGEGFLRAGVAWESSSEEVALMALQVPPCAANTAFVRILLNVLLGFSRLVA